MKKTEWGKNTLPKLFHICITALIESHVSYSFKDQNEWLFVAITAYLVSIYCLYVMPCGCFRNWTMLSFCAWMRPITYSRLISWSKLRTYCGTRPMRSRSCCSAPLCRLISKTSREGIRHFLAYPPFSRPQPCSVRQIGAFPFTRFAFQKCDLVRIASDLNELWLFRDLHTPRFRYMGDAEYVNLTSKENKAPISVKHQVSFLQGMKFIVPVDLMIQPLNARTPDDQAWLMIDFHPLQFEYLINIWPLWMFAVHGSSQIISLRNGEGTDERTRARTMYRFHQNQR